MIWFITVLFLVVVIGGVLAFPYWLERQRHEIGADIRKAAPGKFAKLSQGVTHYRWHGPARGPVVVAIHGLTTPSVVWNDFAQLLGTIGYRVLTYDLYGRGFSDAPDGLQDKEFFIQQLDDLLEHEGLTEDIGLAGYSMGGSIAVAFTQKSPHLVSRLILIASAGVDLVESDFSRFCRTVPIIGDWVHAVAGGFQYRTATLADPMVQSSPEVLAAQLAQADRKGFLPAVLSSRRGMLEETQQDAHRAIGRAGIPVVAVWGGQDSVVPKSAVGKMAKWNREARQDVIEQAGHGLPFSHPEDAFAAVKDLLIN